MRKSRGMGTILDEIRAATADDWPGIWEIFSDVVKNGDTYPYAPDTTEDEGGIPGFGLFAALSALGLLSRRRR